MKTFDVVIVGAGPGGNSLAAYIADSGLKTLLVNKPLVDRDVRETHRIDASPGVPDQRSAECDLMRKADSNVLTEWSAVGHEA